MTRTTIGSTALVLLAFAANLACERKSRFQPGDCVEYVDDKGNLHSGTPVGAFNFSPMRILGEPTPGHFIVEWTVYPPEDFGGQPSRPYTNKTTLPEKDNERKPPVHFTKVLCK